MTASLMGQQRSRGELIAQLYERHAAGLFAYCHDQLGDPDSASDAVTAVFTQIPAAEPPRAALYALARREIFRRDVRRPAPAVDSAIDPIASLIDRVFREMPPHQREALLLAAVCGLTPAELAAVLDVAPDTAEQLTAGARNRFTRSLRAAVTAARSAPYTPPELIAAYDALEMARVEDVLARKPWRRPTASLRNRVLGMTGDLEPAPPPDPQWSGTGSWPAIPPLAPAEPGPITGPITGPVSTGTALERDEAKTEPIPKVSEPSPSGGRRRRSRAAPATGAPAAEAPTASGPQTQEIPAVPAVAAGTAPAAPGVPARETPAVPEPPVHGLTDAPPLWTRDGIAAPGAANRGAPAAPGTPARETDPASGGPAEATAHGEPRPKEAAGAARETVTAPESPARETASRPETRSREAGPTATEDRRQADESFDAFRPAERKASTATPGTGAPEDAASAGEPARKPEKTRRRPDASSPATGKGPGGRDADRGDGGTAGQERVRPKRERHHDWLWELAGLLLCLLIAFLVFTLVPGFTGP